MRKTNRPQIQKNKQMALWARSAGRCHYCNKEIIGDLLSGQWEMNASYIAHIRAVEEGGPRYDKVLSPKLATDLTNLMLLCDVHHRLVDREDVLGHPPERLEAIKRQHEERIRILCEIKDDDASHVLRNAARIGHQESPLSMDSIKQAMVPQRYPAEGNRSIDIEITGLEAHDGSPTFWEIQTGNLRSAYAEKLKGRFERQEIKRLSVFALAPIPLLIELGRLLCDISDVEVYQLLREPKGWRWQEDAEPIDLSLTQSDRVGKRVALIIGVSATISNDRITAVLGDVPIWSISAKNPHNDIIRRKSDLMAFRRVVRQAYERIKAVNGEDAVIHLFPAVPVSAAVEIGRTRMPKADLPMVVYDQNRALGGFIRTIDIS